MSFNIDNLKTQMRKGMLEYCILLLLREGDAYSSEMIEQLKAARLIVMEGTLYPLLTRMKNAGLLGYRWEESPQGPPRKYYQLTEMGRLLLNELSLSWEELSFTIATLRERRAATSEPKQEKEEL